MPAIGVAELAGVGALVVLILDRVFSFVGKMQDRKADASKPDKDERTYALMDRQTNLMERLVPMIEQIHSTTENYDKSGVCPLTKPDGQERVARAVAREIKSKD